MIALRHPYRIKSDTMGAPCCAPQCADHIVLGKGSWVFRRRAGSVRGLTFVTLSEKVLTRILWACFGAFLSDPYRIGFVTTALCDMGCGTNVHRGAHLRTVTAPTNTKPALTRSYRDGVEQVPRPFRHLSAGMRGWFYASPGRFPRKFCTRYRHRSVQNAPWR